jgi:hypothetical protein
VLRAWWLSPEGEVIGPGTAHTELIADHPHRLQPVLRDTFDDPVSALLRAGWVRLAIGGNRATLETHRLTPEAMEAAQRLARFHRFVDWHVVLPGKGYLLPRDEFLILDDPAALKRSSRGVHGSRRARVAARVAVLRDIGFNSEDETDESAARELAPGELDEQGGPYEPPYLPDYRLPEYLANRFRGDYGDAEQLTRSSGFLLPDGRAVEMGDGWSRADDHRAAIPSSAAMRRWGWPEEVARQHDQATRTPALLELLRRSGAARMLNHGTTLAVEFHTPPTKSQIQALAVYTRRHRLEEAILEFPGAPEGGVVIPFPTAGQVIRILSSGESTF